jgi:hypothetical protein
MATKAELQKQLAAARAQAEQDSRAVDLCNKRIEKWDAKEQSAKTGRSRKRARRKLKFWRRRKHARVYALHHSRIDDLVKAIKALSLNRAALAQWAKQYVGTREGSARQRKWANDLGYSASLPWCSIFTATGVEAVFPLHARAASLQPRLLGIVDGLEARAQNRDLPPGG